MPVPAFEVAIGLKIDVKIDATDVCRFLNFAKGREQFVKLAFGINRSRMCQEMRRELGVGHRGFLPWAGELNAIRPVLDDVRKERRAFLFDLEDVFAHGQLSFGNFIGKGRLG